MSERRRMSRAQASAAPEREVRHGVSAAMWWGDPTLDGWRREGIERRAIARAGRVLVAWLIGRWRR